MSTAENVLNSLADFEHHVRSLSAAVGAGQIVEAVGRYLESWSIDRIESLQKIDGGWGAFDNNQRPEPIDSLADIARLSDALSNHCHALKEAQLEPTPELLELNLYFSLARQVAGESGSGRLPSHTAPLSILEEHRLAGRPPRRGAYGNGIAGF